MNSTTPTPACFGCLLAVATLLSGCAGPSDSIIQSPLAAQPIPRPANVERQHTGAIFQPGMTAASLYSGESKPRSIGDTLKIDISENLSASHKVNTDTSRESKLAIKGPGGKTGTGVLAALMNLEATASGNNAFKGEGTTENASKFNAQLAATVINVLPNGNLLVAGDRSIALNGGVTTLRFSGIVNPRDIKAGNVVASADAVNARLEVVGRGDVSDAAQRSWLQRVLSDSLSVW